LEAWYLVDVGAYMEYMMELIWQVAEQFTHAGNVFDVQEHGNGNINDTYLVTVDGGDDDRFILQRINTHVFTRPKLIIRVSRSGKDYHIDSGASFWRAISFINHSQSYDRVLSNHHAREVGYALGRFQSMLSDLSTEKMHDTLDGFHITPQYLSIYDAIMAREPRIDNLLEIRYCHRMIEARRSWVSVLEDAKDRGELRMRIIHGDPKINNFMICDHTGQAVSVVDLDTVKPGLVHYDIGDCLRSTCNLLGEETTDFESVHFDLALAKLILDGYLSVAQTFLNENDYAHIYDAIRLIPFELGLRFFTDYLAGNVYFKVRHVKHNLERALVQFKLTESIEAQETELRAIIADLKVGAV
jgi:Ser/Thr protein kinase RdoA (MazF antagonist)